MRPSEAVAAAVRGRQARLAEWLSRNELFACVIDDFEDRRSSHLRWLSGHPMDALLFVFASGETVLVPWDVNVAAERAVVSRVIPYTDFKRAYRDAVKTVLSERLAASPSSARRKVAFPARTPHLRFAELREDLPGAEIEIQAKGYEEDFLWRSRAVKDAVEMAALMRAAEITNSLIYAIEARLRDVEGAGSGGGAGHGATGLTEIGMAQFIEREALSMGAEGLGFETLAAGPTRSWAIHPFPYCSGGPFAGPGLSILDFGIRVDGYTTDVTLTVARGKLSAVQERMISLVEKAYESALAVITPGASPQAPALKADQVFEEAGWKMPHGLGHGIGLDAHEDPSMRSSGELSCPRFLPGMITTLEPGLYHPEQGGVRWENDVLITEAGARVMTRARIIRVA